MRINFIITTLLFFLGVLSTVNAQSRTVSISANLEDKLTNEVIAFANVVLSKSADSSFIAGTISDEAGLFLLENIKPGNYFLRLSFSGYNKEFVPLFVGENSDFLNLGTLAMTSVVQSIAEVVVEGKLDEISSKMDKKVFTVEDNLSQSGGSVLQAMENLPGVTIQDNKVQLRGSDKIVILIDGKQSALTGFGSQSGLDNIPASSIDRIEIINNPSSKFDANGNAGIINIILKKEKKEGWNGKVGMTAGIGALWVKNENLPTIRPQYQNTPKINPSLSLNYRKKKVNVFAQLDDLFTQTLNKNEFVTRTYDDGTVINQQTKRNRNTNFLSSKLGLDWSINDNNQFTLSGMYGNEKIIDNGDQPFFNSNNSERLRLWKFVEDEVKTTVMGNMGYLHKFKQPGRTLNTSLNYTFHREDERYTFENILPTYSGTDAFKLLSDEHVVDFSSDYVQALKYGKLETGIKLRYRTIPTNMQFFPSAISPLDTNAGGKATYNEIIPAVYANYLFDTKRFEGEIGLRIEYVKLNYQVNPNHPTYKSDGYSYIQPFPNVRLGYKINENNRLSVFYNRRVDRPNEVDIRIFPKYDDAEIIKVGNPSLKPQFTNSLELGHKYRFKKGYLFTSVYSRFSDATITRISTIAPGSTLIYAVFQNAGKSSVVGAETVFSHDVNKFFSYNLNVSVYYNQINAFTVNNLYPTPITYAAPKQSIYSGNLKLNTSFHLKRDFDLQLTAIYLAPDVIPQGRINQRFTMNLGVKKKIQNGKGEIILNASDLLNTMVIKKQIIGNGFHYTSSDYYETQVFRLGYSYKF